MKPIFIPFYAIAFVLAGIVWIKVVDLPLKESRDSWKDAYVSVVRESDEKSKIIDSLKKRTDSIPWIYRHVWMGDTPNGNSKTESIKVQSINQTGGVTAGKIINK